MKRHMEMVRAQVPGISNLAAYFHAKWGGDLQEKRLHGLEVLRRQSRRRGVRAALAAGAGRRYVPPVIVYDVPLDKSGGRAHYLNRYKWKAIAAAFRKAYSKVRRFISRGN